MNTIDMTPSWRQALKILLTVRDSNLKGRNNSVKSEAISDIDKELQKMADVADKFVELFPNGFDSWQETHFEIVSYLSNTSSKPISVAYEHYEYGGTTALYRLAKLWTDEFEQEYKGRIWDGDFFNVIQSWLEAKG